MIQQEFLIRHYHKAVEELNKSACKGEKKVFYNFEDYDTLIGWKHISYKLNNEIVQGEYDPIKDVIYISDKFKSLVNKEKFDTTLIAEIKLHIVSSYLFKELQLEDGMITRGNFFFTGLVEWLNRHKPLGAEDIKISNNDMELYKLYYKDIYTNHLDNEDFEDFNELVSFLESKNNELVRQREKLEKEVVNKSHGDTIYRLFINYVSNKETNIKVEMMYSISSWDKTVDYTIFVDVPMYLEYKYIRTKCLDLINDIEAGVY